MPGALYGDVALRWSRELGSIDNLSTGEKDADEATSRLGRLRLRYAPAGGPLDIMLTVQRETLDADDELYVNDAMIRDRDFVNGAFGSQMHYERDVNSYALTVAYDLDGITLNSVTAWQDRDMPRLLVTPPAYRSFGADPGYLFEEEQRGVSQELRLSFGEGRRLGGVGGLFVQDIDFTRREPALAFIDRSESENHVDTRSHAVFGEATYAVTEALDLTAGARFAHEEVTADDAGTFSYRASADFSGVSPKLALGDRIDPDNRVYALISRGFKPGGFNRTVSSTNDSVPYDSETSTNDEIGWRGSMFDGVAELTAAAYLIKTRDKQFYVGLPGFQVLRNIGDAESRGVELNADLHPAAGLTVSFGTAMSSACPVPVTRSPTAWASWRSRRRAGARSMRTSSSTARAARCSACVTASSSPRSTGSVWSAPSWSTCCTTGRGRSRPSASTRPWRISSRAPTASIRRRAGACSATIRIPTGRSATASPIFTCGWWCRAAMPSFYRWSATTPRRPIATRRGCPAGSGWFTLSSRCGAARSTQRAGPDTVVPAAKVPARPRRKAQGGRGSCRGGS
ncbi:TonB-dependent receptor [Azospirillum sp. RWY-5-1]|uniref:TonB-dependent receptor n=1 Tax=Azospirillum oleiclasticum TaxID=2735135 RepID=A0ABX2T901_9PROT|nr:TonB-dependent receptor [Azospirillum oleiclasticum]NYZ20807.1 TonB-dependent receptor [Azospirillum oleiclasticum]